MFRTAVFTEMSYPYLPPIGPDETYDSIRVTLPNKHYDPEVGHQMYDMFFDIYRAADDFGLDIAINEHHATATCLDSTMPLSMAIIARETTRARIFCLGNPVANRPDPVRVAEEMAMIDVLSQGRTEVGFVRGSPPEISATNTSPADDHRARFWEAVDLIIKAWTSHEGPFSWEGEHFQHRQVNIWPRPYQEPHPPVWVTTLSKGSTRDIAAHGFNVCTVMNGTAGCRAVFEAYREGREANGLPPASIDQFGYMGVVAVGETDRQGVACAERLMWHFQNQKNPIHFSDIPGFVDIKTRAAIIRQEAFKPADVPQPYGPAVAVGAPASETVTKVPGQMLATSSAADLRRDGFVFAGSPSTVAEQICAFSEAVGGLGLLVAMMQSGTVGSDLARRNMELFGSEVLPRVRAEIG
jgi:alkanesulfonate monooxygenase SsuD/methylene tetrahydromethanopterin reductase-like flavin-dependent oxidoreductase (luciferase family)